MKTADKIGDWYANNLNLKKLLFTAGTTFPSSLGISMLYHNIIAKVPDYHWAWAHFSGGATAGSFLYSVFRTKMSRAKASLSTLISITGASAAWELIESNYIAAKNQTMNTDSTLEQIVDTAMVLAGLLATAANHYLINKYSGSPPGKNQEGSMS